MTTGALDKLRQIITTGASGWPIDFSDFFQQAADSKSQIRKSASQPAGHRYLLKEDQRDGLRSKISCAS
jgi:hypothetical protein